MSRCVSFQFQLCSNSSFSHSELKIFCFAQIVLEMIELRELETARAILRQTQAMGVMKQEQPQRYLRLEHLLVRTYFDPNEVFQIQQYFLFSFYNHALYYIPTQCNNNKSFQNDHCLCGPKGTEGSHKTH